MKKHAIILAMLLLAAGCAHQKPAASILQQVGGEQMILGEVLYPEILRHFPAWKEEDQRSEADPVLAGRITQVEEPVEILCYFGSWCGDSREALTIFMKTLNAAQNKRITVKLIGVDRKKDDPLHTAKLYGIEYVPTFIVFQNGGEIGRMIEFPMKENFVEDLLDILQSL